jgi:hypothetical protein
MNARFSLMSGYSIVFDRASIAAPRAASARTAAALFSAAAHISAVSPRQPSTSLTLAPAAISRSITSGDPVRAAVIRIVSPSGVVAFGSAPASSSARVSRMLPLAAASESGVMPYRLAAEVRAPL